MKDPLDKSSAKSASLLMVMGVVIWPLLFSTASLVFSDRQKTSIEALTRIRASLFQLERGSKEIESTFAEIRGSNEKLRADMKVNTGYIRDLKEDSRSRFIRLKGKNTIYIGQVVLIWWLGIPEEENEDTAGKIVELLEYLGYQIEASDIERANRVGSKSEDRAAPRAIVVELASYKLKQSVLVEAANKLRHTAYRFFGQL